MIMAAAYARGQELLAKRRLAHRHLWTAMVAYAVDPMAESNLLSPEFMVTPPMTGCIICEEDFSPEMLDRPCPGDPQ